MELYVERDIKDPPRGEEQAVFGGSAEGGREQAAGGDRGEAAVPGGGLLRGPQQDGRAGRRRGLRGGGGGAAAAQEREAGEQAGEEGGAPEAQPQPAQDHPGGGPGGEERAQLLQHPGGQAPLPLQEVLLHLRQHLPLQLSPLRRTHLPAQVLQDPLRDQVPQLRNTILIPYALIHLILLMLVQPNAAASGDSLLARLKEAVLKLTWKHALLISLPLCLYIYPKPVMRLFMPLASKLSNNHPDVACNETLEQIILTTNPELTPAALAKTHVLKGTPPRLQNYAQNEVVTIELFSSERRANLFSSFSTLQPHAYNEESVNLYGETLWNSFRLTKIENPQMKALIIRSSQPILVQFLLKFYKISRSESHKIGVVTDSRLVVLRLDRRVGTYEHLTCELQKF